MNEWNDDQNEKLKEKEQEENPQITSEFIETCDIEKLIDIMSDMDHSQLYKLNFEVEIKDELQSYNILNNNKYNRFKELKEVLDDRKRLALLAAERADPNGKFAQV